MQSYAFFLGCITSNRYPGVEQATKKVVERFGGKLLVMEGTSCCPAPGVFGSFHLPSWLAVAARNITIAENMNMNITVTCNGCYASLQEANHLLKHNEKLKSQVNEVLSKVGRKYQGSVEVKHIISVLSEDAGLEAIKKEVKHPLKGVKVAVHYGCHFLKPSEVRMHGSTEKPTLLDDLVRALGAESVDYREKIMCCGAGGGVRAGNLDVALDMTKEKIENMIKAEADCVVTPCCFCHLQFDRGQVELSEKTGRKYGLPVVYITQLVGLALGMAPDELGLRENEFSTEPFLKKI